MKGSRQSWISPREAKPPSSKLTSVHSIYEGYRVPHIVPWPRRPRIVLPDGGMVRAQEDTGGFHICAMHNSEQVASAWARVLSVSQKSPHSLELISSHLEICQSYRTARTCMEGCREASCTRAVSDFGTQHLVGETPIPQSWLYRRVSKWPEGFPSEAPNYANH